MIYAYIHFRYKNTGERHLHKAVFHQTFMHVFIPSYRYWYTIIIYAKVDVFLYRIVTLHNFNPHIRIHTPHIYVRTVVLECHIHTSTQCHTQTQCYSLCVCVTARFTSHFTTVIRTYYVIITAYVFACLCVVDGMFGLLARVKH